MNKVLQSHVETLTSSGFDPAYQTDLGVLYQGDCLPWLKSVPSSTGHMIFADPPFNLGKDYGSSISDKMQEDDYINWSQEWLKECIRILAPGGALFVFNLPKWLIPYGAFLNEQDMSFRHWIACRMPKAYPRGKKMSPAHYGLLYYTKGQPRIFNKVYVPIQTCRHCGKEIRDYGGHRKKLNPKGINLMDVFDILEDVWEDIEHPTSNTWTEAEEIWDDVPPVRHSKYKVRDLKRNELAPIMLERIIAMTTDKGNLVLDPFGGSGTTYYAAQKMDRYWLGIELGDVKSAIRRLEDYREGRCVEWESARGNGHRKSINLTQEELPLPK